MATLLITRKTSSRSILVIKNTTRSIRVSGVIQRLLHLLRHRGNSSLQPGVVLTEGLELLRHGVLPENTLDSKSTLKEHT